MKNLLVVLSLFVCTASAQNITDSLLLHYPMDANANDVSGNNFHGTVNGATLVSDRFGNPNAAYYFDGVNDYIDFPVTSTLKPSYPLTISCWINLDLLLSPLNIIINTDYIVNDYFGIGMAVDDVGNLQISINGGNGFCNPGNRITFKSTNATVVPGVWYHIVGVIHSATNMDLYIDCIDAQAVYHSGTGPTTIAYTNYAPGNLGRNDGAGSPMYLQGSMDDFRYWNRALSQVEILSLCDSAAVAVSSWDCVNGTCIDLGNASGAYADSASCQLECIMPPSTWDCVNNVCVDPGNGTGQYNSLLSCQAICKPTVVNGVAINKEKVLLKIVNILGEEVSIKEKGLLFYIYDDGTVEKKTRIE